MSYVNENFKKLIDLLNVTAESLGFSAYKSGADFITEEENGLWARFTGEKGVFAVNLNEEKVTLFTGEDAENPTETPKKVSVCLFDADISEKDLKYVTGDFCETLRKLYSDKPAAPTKKQQQKATQTVSKAAVKNGSFYDPTTLASKLCIVFPELRPYYKENIDTYGEFLAEEFFTKYGTKKVIDAIKQNNPQTMKKLFQVLNEIYEDGTNDTQSLIAVTIMGELGNDQILLAQCVDYMSETMAPPVIEVNKYLASLSGKKAKKKLLNPPAYKPKKQKKPGMFAQAMAQSGGPMPPM